MKIGHWSIAMSSYGREIYRETAVAFGGAVRTGARAWAGILARRLSLRIERYGSWSGWVFDAGLRVALTRSWTMGFSTQNLGQKSMGQGQPLPQVTRASLEVRPSSGFRVCVELDKDVRYPAELRCGMEWSPCRPYRLRAGFSRNPSRFTLGTGLVVGCLWFDYACSFHPVLGETHHVSTTFSMVRRSAGSGPGNP
jgi:hypothetical protein